MMSTIFYTESTPTSTSSGNVAAGVASATITSAAGKMAYITGFAITGSGATAASVIQPTVTGVIGGTMTFTMAIPAGVTAAVTPLMVNFPLPLSASNFNTNIVVSTPSFGAGNTNTTVTVYGYFK